MKNIISKRKYGNESVKRNYRDSKEEFLRFYLFRLNHFSNISISLKRIYFLCIAQNMLKTLFYNKLFQEFYARLDAGLNIPTTMICEGKIVTYKTRCHSIVDNRIVRTYYYVSRNLSV